MEKQSSRFYAPALDIVRFFAFFAVFTAHALPRDPAQYQGRLAPFALFIVSILGLGGYGVDLFFALSSYLITELLYREYEITGQIHAAAFYVRRALRIFPLYYLFVCFALFIFPHFVAGAEVSGQHQAGLFFFFFNWVCAFIGYSHNPIIAPLWSVSVEEQFYFIFPFAVRRIGFKNLKKFAAALLLIGTASRLLVLSTGFFNEPVPAIWDMTLTHVDSIAAGILLAVYIRQNKALKTPRPLPTIALCVLTQIFVTVICQNNVNSSLVIFPVVAATSAIIIWAVLKSEVNSRIGSALTYLGKISYGLYVYHMLCLYIADTAVKNMEWLGNFKIVARMFFGLALTLAFAFFSYNLFEKHFLKLKKRFTFVQSRPI